jgi:hypothetical protein
MHCLRKLKKEVSPAGGKCPAGLSPDMKSVARARTAAVHDKYKGERCVLIANGPSLNKIRWDWQDRFKVRSPSCAALGNPEHI